MPYGDFSVLYAIDMLPDLKVRGFSDEANSPSGSLYGWLDKAVGLPEILVLRPFFVHLESWISSNPDFYRALMLIKIA